METGRPTFRKSMLLSGLLTQEMVDQAESAVRDETGETQVSDDDLANKLVEWGEATAYQVEQMQSGRTKFLLGPYIVTDWIGQGGMGQVYKAVHEVMGRECAVKVLPLSKATDEAISNFRREIRLQAQLDHPHLVRALDAGREGKVHYLVTEYVPGDNLRRLVRTEGPLTMRQAAGVIRQTALGLQYAHDQHLIHRDVKPGNILVTPDGVAKLSDLGLSGFLHEERDDPRAGKIVGTADYLSPEQIKSPDKVTAASDIYSLGCTLYYAISGKVPYPGGTTRDKARRHCEETPWHPRRFNTEISEEFVEIIADMMEKDPKERVESAGEVAARLEPWVNEGEALQGRQLTKSPWLSPPIPTDDEDDQDTDGGGDADSGRAESTSQTSIGTMSNFGGSQDTRPIRSSQRVKPPPLTLSDSSGLQDQYETQQMSRGVAVAIALAVAIPVSMLIGAMLSLIFMTLFGAR